jgi:probable rRNA maturation factor
MHPTIILKKKVAGLDEARLVEFVVRATRTVGLRGTVTVLITGNSEIRSLNSRFRDKNSSTDVLSFPAPGFARGFSGDVVVSVDMAARNARRLGHSVADEIRVLVLHGILHLAGYDHESDQGQMAGKEERLRTRLGLPAGLIERSAKPAPGRRQMSRVRQARSRA